MTTTQISNEVMEELDSRVRELSKQDYLNVLEDIRSDIESRIEATETEMEMDEGDE